MTNDQVTLLLKRRTLFVDICASGQQLLLVGSRLYG
jgi:hypothetical protein